MNSFRALCAVAEGSRKLSAERFRQTHSSTTSETSCCLVMPRNSHCFVSHSNCFELTSIRSAPPDRSGSSGDDPDSFFRTHQIAGRQSIGFNGNCAIIQLGNCVVRRVARSLKSLAAYQRKTGCPSQDAWVSYASKTSVTHCPK
jgi:hypothetical protein